MTFRKHYRKVACSLAIIGILGIGITNTYANELTDIKSHWAKDVITKLTDKEIIKGYPGGTFKPNNTITRAEFSKMLLKSLETDISFGDAFDDIRDHWAESEIYTLVEKGIIDKSEYGDNFNPDENITRIEIAKMIDRALWLEEKAKSMKDNTKFADDNSIKADDKGYVTLAVENKIINGYPDNTFKPNQTATRAESSKMIDSMMKIDIPNRNIVEVNKILKNRPVEKRLPQKSVATYKEPKCYKELKANMNKLKVYDYTIAKKDYEMVDIDQIVANGDVPSKPYGVIRMKLQGDFETNEVDFEGEAYIDLYNDKMIEDDFRGGYLIKDGKVLDHIARIGGYKSDIIKKANEQTFRPLYSARKDYLYKADYLAFRRKAKHYFTSIDNEVECIIIVFENPFKKE